MKPAVKIGSLLLAVIIACSAVFASGCSLSKEWAYKSGDKEQAIGVYIYALDNAYNEALTYAKELDDYDGTKDSWLDMEITDDDGNTAVARQWIKDKAQETCLSYFVLENMLTEEGATVDEATMQQAEEQAKEYWEVGPYTSMNYIMPYKSSLEPFGISFESFKYCTSLYSVNYAAVFRALYEEGGSQEVSTDEMVKFVNENYTDYSYFQISLSKASTDEAGESTTEAMTDEEVAEAVGQLDGYVKDIKDGKSFEDVVSAYMEASGVTEDPSTSNIEKLEDSSLGDEVKDAIEKLSNGEAAVVQVGEGSSAIAYLVYKRDITKSSEDYAANESNRTSLLKAIKGDEFDELIKSKIKDLDYEKSSAVDKYDPKMFFAAEEPTTEAATEAEVDEYEGEPVPLDDEE